jgi:hypothetical protein
MTMKYLAACEVITCVFPSDFITSFLCRWLFVVSHSGSLTYE